MIPAEPLWTRDFLITGTISFLQSTVFYMLLVVIAGYAVHEMHATTTQAGIISGLFIVGMLMGRLFVNQIVDVIGRKTTLWTAAFIFMLCSIVYFFIQSIESLTLIRFIHGVSFGVANSILGTIIAQIIPISRRAEGVGYYSLSITLGTALGPFLGILLVLNASYQAIFAASIIISILACLVCIGLKIPALPQKKSPSVQQIKQSLIHKVLEPAALPIGLVVFVCSVCYASILSFITFYAQHLQLEKAATLFFLVYAIAIILSRPFTGKLMDRHGENIVMYPALATLALAFLVLSLTQNSVHLLISAALFGLGFGNMQSIGQAIAIKCSATERMGFATSTYFIALDAGIGFGPFLLGALLVYINYEQMYLLAAIVVAISIAIYFLVHGHKVSLANKKTA